MQPVEATKELLALFKNIQQIIRAQQPLLPKNIFKNLDEKLQTCRTFITELSLQEDDKHFHTTEIKNESQREIRNWLTVIVGHSEQLQKHNFSKIEVKGRLSAIILSAWSIARLLDR